MVNEQPQEGQIYISTYSKMPAMPKEKTSAVSFNKNTSSELKFKDQNPTNGVNTAAEHNSTIASNNRIHHLQNPRICGCGAASVEVNSGNSKPINGHMSTVPVVLIGAEAESPKRNAACTCGKLNHINDNDRGRILVGENYNHDKVTTNVHKLVSYAKPVKKSANDYIFRKYIGEGSFSIVYLAIDVQTKREYAIKVCEKRHILREHKQEYIRREREVMHIMTNVTGFVNLSCTFQDHRSLYFVMTYAKNGDLLPYINKVGSFDIDCTRHYAAELVLACEEMHRRNIVHRDLKPENILLDSNMHTLIADFGSAKILTPEDRLTSFSYDEGDEDNNGIVGELDPSVHMRLQHRYNNKRRGSFVGTAQYVSPEVLQNGQITPATDLWALGCIVYQMISGLPPFRGSNDYVIFKEILACDVEFPQGFNETAEDLVRCLLKIDPVNRLGALDGTERYNSIRSHPFFDGVDFDTLRQQTPPAIYPYLPGVLKDEDFRSSYRVPEVMEPGLDDKQLTRLLGMELGTSVSNQALSNDVMIDQRTISKNVFDISENHKQQRLELQKADKWHVFTNNEVILKKGYINKRKGLFARKRMLLLTTGPHLIYIDPAQMIKKGEIPWNHELRVEAKNFKIFFVHTPNRTYYLEDPEGYSLEWVNAIENMHMLIYNDPAYVGSQLSASVKKPLSA